MAESDWVDEDAGDWVDEVPKAKPSQGKAAVGGAYQGVTLGFGDEIAGALGRLLVGDGVKLGKGAQPSDKDTPELRALKEQALAEEAARPSSYEISRDLVRGELKDAQAAHPGTFLAGELAGGLLLPVPGGAAAQGASKGAKLLRSMGQGAALGAGYGLGHSEAALNRGDIKGAAADTAMGGLVGAGAGALGHGVQAGVGKIADKIVSAADTRLGRALAKAKEKAAKDIAEEIATKKSLAGRTATAAYKNVRNIVDAEAEDIVTGPLKQATFNQLKAEMGESGLKGLVPDAAAKEAASQALREAVETQEQAIAKKAAELLKPTPKKDARSFIKAYGEQLAGMSIGGYAGRKLDETFETDGLFTTLGTGAGFMTGRTRAGKALLDRLGRPGNQAAIARALRKAGEVIGGTERGLGRTAATTGRLGAKPSAREILLGHPAMASEEDAALLRELAAKGR